MLAARYRVVDLLGRGGMGDVYRAEDLKLGETMALKLLPEELSSDGAALALLHQEVRMARRITHKNVVRVHDVGENDGVPFITNGVRRRREPGVSAPADRPAARVESAAAGA